MKVIISYFGTMCLGPTLVELVWQLIERYKKNQAWWWWQTGLDFLNAIKVRLNSDAWNEFFQVLYSSTITFLSLWCKLIGANFFWAKNHASKSSHYFTAFVSSQLNQFCRIAPIAPVSFKVCRGKQTWARRADELGQQMV